MFSPEPWHPDRPGLWRPGRLDPLGVHGPTRSQAQHGTVRRTSRGLYLPAHVEQSTGQRVVEAAMVCQPGQVITGWANLFWRGARWFPGLDASGAPLPVEILIGTRNIRPRHGQLHLCGEQVGAHQKEWVDGVPLAEVLAAVAFLMRYARSVRAAARVLSMAAYDDLVSIEEMTAFLVPGLSGWTGVPQARDALALATENAWSPAELDMGLVWCLDAVRPRPAANVPVFDAVSGRHVATPDLLDAEAGVAGEYESSLHLARPVRHADVGREGLLRAHDLEVVTMTADDRLRPAGFIARLHQAYARAARRPDERRTWTVEPPPWWTPTTTVAQRRALTPEQRQRFLRYRLS